MISIWLRCLAIGLCLLPFDAGAEPADPAPDQQHAIVNGPELSKFAFDHIVDAYQLIDAETMKTGVFEFVDGGLHISWRDEIAGFWGIINNERLCVRDEGRSKKRCFTVFAADMKKDGCTYYLYNNDDQKWACLRPASSQTLN